MKKVNSIKLITILILMSLTLTIFPAFTFAYTVPGGDIDHPATVLVDDENDLKKAINTFGIEYSDEQARMQTIRYVWSDIRKIEK